MTSGIHASNARWDRRFPRVRCYPPRPDTGYERRALAQDLRDRSGWRLIIVKRREQVFRIAGLNWIVERTFAWLGRHRRMSKDYEYRVQTSETLITIAACIQMIRRTAPA